MATYKEEMPGGKKSEYLGNHTYTTEAGHVVEFDNTPGDRRIHVYHASGTFLEIKDDGVMITKVEGKTQEFNNKGKDQKITGEFNITVTGDVKMHVTGSLLHEVKGNYEIVTHGDFKVKAAGKNVMEFGGDQRVQVNGKTSHRSSGDRDEITGGNKTVTTNRDHFEGIGGEMQLNVSDDISIGAGNDYAVNAVRQIGMGAGDQIGIASGDIMKLKSETQIQTHGTTGTFIDDDYGVQVRSFGSAGSLMIADGYKVGIFSKYNDIRISAGGKVLTQTDGGTQLDTAAVIPPIGKFY